MTPAQLRERITAWAVDVAHLVKPLFKSHDTRDRASQLKRAADSAAINYRAACMARSHKEFLSKLSIALEEADESVGWLEMSAREGVLRGGEAERLLDEACQITRILAASRNTAQARENLNRKRPR
jgi:four helix bundle protein